MNKNVITLYDIKRFTDQCFDRDNDKVVGIIKGILDAKSPRISDISNTVDSNQNANYRIAQRSLDNNSPRENIHRLFNESSSIVIGDPTEIERLQAKKNEYLGR
ncbi:MAG: hypothetical protein ACUVWN_16305 [bacterium]